MLNTNQLRTVALIIAGCGAVEGDLTAQTVAAVKQYKQMSLEDLMNQEVVTASRKPQKFSLAPMAMDVLTEEDIDRYGATTLMDTLRIAPGLHVARSVGNSYAISSRGFNNVSANKMQVLMDGRPLYSPLFSGVFWDVQDTLLEDIERIEVVRGPGSTSWGANAINGVINIMTKSSRDTQGTLLQGGAGNEELGYGGVRYGGRAGENTFYRIYSKYRYRDDQVLANGQSAEDFSSHAQSGFRADSYLQNDNLLTVQGDIFYNEFGRLGQNDSDHNGGNVLGKWTKSFSDSSNLQLQAYFERSDREVPLLYHEQRNIADVDMQHRFQLGNRNDLVWGASYRGTEDKTSIDRIYQFDPSERTLHRVDWFVQDEIAVVPDKLNFLLGSKFEHNDLTGFEVQPTARLSILPTSTQMLWAGITRGVRTPTRVEHDLVFRSGSPDGPVLIRGNTDFGSEEVLSYEVGYRIHSHEKFSFDLAAYYSRYDDLRTVESPRGGGIPLTLENELRASVYGGELTLRYQLLKNWRLMGSYGLIEKDLNFSLISRDTRGAATSGNDPEHIATFRSTLDLPHNLQFDQTIRYVSELPNPRVDSYIELDLRLAWRFRDNLDIAIIGTSLLNDSHGEFNESLPMPVEVERSIHARLTWEF